MNPLRSRYWIIGRRIGLILIALVVGYRSYGDSLATWFQRSDPGKDIVITGAEFRTGPAGDPPLWFIELRNNNRTLTYDRVLLEATYMDDSGRTTEIGRIVVNQRLAPGEEQLIGSRDPELRASATSASLKVLDAEVIE